MVEFTQPRPTKASGTRTNMLRARQCLRSRVAALCQPVHECVSPHRPLDEPCEWWTNRVAERRSRSTCSTATLPCVCSRTSRHLATFFCSCACSRSAVLCCLVAACWLHSHQAAASSSSAYNVSLTTAGACMAMSTTGDVVFRGALTGISHAASNATLTATSNSRVCSSFT